MEAFLREFDGVTISYMRNGRPDTILPDANRAAANADEDWVASYSESVGFVLAPIGFSNYNHITLMTSSDLSFYGGFDDYLFALGSGVGEMLDSLIGQENQPLSRIPVTLDDDD